MANKMEEREKEVLKEAFKLEDKTVAVLLANHNSRMKMIRNDMVNSLNLLDGVAEGDEEKKEELRKKILDNYNDLVRENHTLIEELTKNLQKE